MDNILNNYLDEQGRVTRYPSKKHRSDRDIIYEYLITKFDNEKKYTEKEVNEIIKAWITFDDYCIVRRELYEYQLLCRAHDCSLYWVNKKAAN